MTFPYYTKGGFLAYLYRPDSPYDVYSTKIKEMAACMGMKENTIASRLKRGREILRQEITVNQ